MDTQVWMELAQEFEKALSFYNSSSDEIDIDVVRPHLRKAGKSYFQLLQENEHIEITTPPEFLVRPVLENVTDSSGRTHRFTDAHDLYWICVLGLLGRCGYIIVKNKILREMKIPMSHTRQGAEADWSAYFLHGLGPREGFLLNEKDYVIDVCEASIQACQFLISEYGHVAEEPAEPKQLHKTASGERTETSETKIDGEWSKPMTKKEMMSALRIDGYKKFNTYAKQYGLRQAGNRQLWQIRLDNMDSNNRQKLEKA